MSWTQPICEACWIRREGIWEPSDDDGHEIRLSVRQPIAVINAGIEQCAFCGRPTVIGVFVRANPADVPFPRRIEVET